MNDYVGFPIIAVSLLNNYDGPIKGSLKKNNNKEIMY